MNVPALRAKLGDGRSRDLGIWLMKVYTVVWPPDTNLYKPDAPLGVVHKLVPALARDVHKPCGI